MDGIYLEKMFHIQVGQEFYWPENYNARRDDISKYNPTVEEVVDVADARHTMVRLSKKIEKS